MRERGETRTGRRRGQGRAGRCLCVVVQAVAASVGPFVSLSPRRGLLASVGKERREKGVNMGQEKKACDAYRRLRETTYPPRGLRLPLPALRPHQSCDSVSDSEALPSRRRPHSLYSLSRRRRSWRTGQTPRHSRLPRRTDQERLHILVQLYKEGSSKRVQSLIVAY